MNKTLTTGLVLAAHWQWRHVAGNSFLSTPDVYFSYATDACVKVINYTDEQFDCSTLSFQI